MGFDEAFKSVVVSSNAKLSLDSGHLLLRQEKKEARLFLKDINIIILESLQITLTSALLSALAEHKIVLLTCDSTHHINGVFTAYLGHFQSAKIAKEQMRASVQKKAVLWQKIIKNKITNQAYVLQTAKKHKESKELLGLAKSVSLGDSKNLEAVAAAIYFRALFGKDFNRDSLCYVNMALNYGYAIVRACVVRSVCISGLVSWLGIKHDNIYNGFNLCDDLIEVFRPFVDFCVLKLSQSNKEPFLKNDDKEALIETLQAQTTMDSKNFPLNRAISRYVQSFKSALLGDSQLGVVTFAN